MAIKPSGIKLNWLSSIELASGVILFFCMIPFATSAYHNINAQNRYDEAVGHYTGGDYVQAGKKLIESLEHQENVYFPHELLGMTYFNQGDSNQAETTFRKLSERTDIVPGAGDERVPLAKLAVINLKLLDVKKRKVDHTDAAYVELADKIGQLSGRSSAFLEPRIVEAQIALDGLSDKKTSLKQREATLDGVRQKMEVLEKESWKKPPSVWGLAILYNTLGVVNFELGMIRWDEIVKKKMSQATKGPAIARASELTRKGTNYFRRSMQLKLPWEVPMVNLERALAFKLVEEGMDNAKREEWMKVGIDYDLERKEHLGYMKYTLGKKEEKIFPRLDPGTNLYTLYVSLGWAHSMVDKYNRARTFQGEASSANKKRGEAVVNRARQAAKYWKQYEGLKAFTREEYFDSRKQAKELYKRAVNHGGVTNDALRRVRIKNNFGVFLFVGEKAPVQAELELDQALKSLNQLVNNPSYASTIAKENLMQKVKVNLKTVLQKIVDTPSIPHDQRKAYKAKLDVLD